MHRTLLHMTLYFVMMAIGVSAYSQCNTQNLVISNHSFEIGFSDWNTRRANGAVVTFNTVTSMFTDGALSAETEVTTLGNNYWDVQIKRIDIELEAGTEYLLSFDAKTLMGTSNMRFGLNTALNNTFITNGLAALNDTWKSFELVFTPNSTEDAALFFNYGDILGTFYLDNVVIKEVCNVLPSQASFCKTPSAPGINGSEGALWADAIQYNLLQTIDGVVTNGSDLSAYYKVIWNNNNLFLVVNVNDDILLTDSQAGLESMDDGVELFLDIGNDKSMSYDGVDDHHFLFRWNDATIYHLSAGTQNPTGAQAAFINKANGNGYIYEIKLPWSLIGNGIGGQVIGIDVQVNDDDTGGNSRDARIGWNASSTDVDSNPSLFGEGRLDLVLCGESMLEYEPVLCADLPTEVYHASGLIVNHYGNIWTHNDKQGINPPDDNELFELDGDGNLLRTVLLTGVENTDWEDMTTDEDGNMYVGEFGSGNSPYTDLHIYKIKNAFYSCDTNFSVEEINFRYPTGGLAGDTESMFYWNGDIYLLPKNNKGDANDPRAGRLYLFKIPAIPNPGSQYTAELLYDINLNPNYPAEPIDQYKVASADLSPDGKTLVMLWGRRFWLVTDFTPGIFLDGTITAVDFPVGLYWQREAVAFADNNTIFTIDEDNADNPNRGKLGKIEICDILPDHHTCDCDIKKTTAAALTSQNLAEEYTNGNVNTTSSDLELTFDNASTGNQIVGLRFSDLGIPSRASIQSAYIQFVVDETDVSQTSNLEIWAESTLDAAPFESTSQNVSSRTKTARSVQWSFNDWTVPGVAFAEHRTADISSLVQEVVAQTGWSANNAIAFIIEGQGSQTAKKFACPSEAPRLWVEYCKNDIACVTNLSILNQSIPSNTYQAGDAIISTGIVEAPNNVEFRANTISLNAEFEVEQAATFHAVIDPCL